MPEPVTETFEAFKNSFFYGSRSDLAFKFLKNLSNEDAAEFFRELLENLGRTVDDGDAGRLVRLAVEWQARAYAGEGGGRWTYEDAPFAPLEKPVRESVVGLLTSSGHFVEDDDPEPFGVKGMTQEEACRRIKEFLKAPPTLSRIPADVPAERLRVRHGGYDVRAAQADPNVVFPVDRLRELEAEGAIGRRAGTFYSFVGACSQLRLLRDHAPRWAGLLRDEGVAAVLLVPV
ncbi:glycine/sarcosine/betaine reductase selenoprotein B family protein [Deferrisoma camini]|uniref:glycine/sarcosine/betaine reductase selenoprotein B family protein n=1 Tax=Deferrisoma camini TaxID=1035120 RepID=UPI00046CE0CE|nr:glycine/sarcosine/betaine reductase selenoprotein B family protein [Deferrisoma camini]